MRTTTTFTILLAGLLGAAWAFGQDLTLRVDVSLVTLDVEVTDSAGRPVNTLKKEDFQVYENGTFQDLRTFDSVETPYNILLLFDCSPSTEADWPFLVEAMNRFRRMVRPQDRVEIAQFGEGFKVVQKWFGQSEQAIDVTVQTNISLCWGTNFYGAMTRALDELKSVKGRKGVVVLSDGGHDNIPTRTGERALLSRSRYADAVDDKDFQKLQRAVAGSDVNFYFVAVNTDLNPDEFDPERIYNMQQLRSRIEVLASVSGGRVVFPKKADEVVKLYEQLAHDLGTSYSLGYVPSNLAKDGTLRTIEVRLRDRSLHVRQSREGYRAQ